MYKNLLSKELGMILLGKIKLMNMNHLIYISDSIKGFMSITLYHDPMKEFSTDITGMDLIGEWISYLEQIKAYKI